MPQFARPVVHAVLALTGWAALVVAGAIALWGEHSGRDAMWTVLAPVLFGLACASHLAAFAADLWTTRTRRRVPVVALHYAAVIAGIGLWRLTAELREAAWYREDPLRMSVEIEDDVLAVRTSAGVWHVPLGACAGGPVPGVEYSTIATHEFNGTVKVLLDTATRPYMRLAVPERRIKCLL